ncbi:MAG TPA: polyprenyl synthetase family protein [Gemmatimonadaceae bacterium]|nr:polyprenyl synthetase family protein [Gemmatimonadaceae bacterium]
MADRLAADDDTLAIESALSALCTRYLGDLPAVLADAITYSILGEGKRLRPRLLLAAYRAAGGTGNAVELAATVEVVHAYSLVHDDLPCMDNDELRRGRPTTHRRFGVRVATVAGVVMVPLAARAAFDASRSLGLPRQLCGDIVRVLMRASGAGGMVGGQLLDLASEGCELSVDELDRIHRAKTGELIAASIAIGGLAAGVALESRTALERFGERVGLAFQIADDVLDATATSDQLGKSAGRDAARSKRTYPALLGVDGALSIARSLVDDGCAELRDVGLATPELERLARYAVARQS